ncbi:hypothetical protein H4Q26_013132 [Puccinia striiformis f. sp. tritici PST-130]|nr:hypothetical protein H4Q26_013132 [Puccinia striiformis f. sp. tritici PST-130]
MLHPESYTTLPSASISKAVLESYDAIIVGAGIGGSALAYALTDPSRNKKRQRPLSILLIERDLRQPDRIVGELLQPGGCLAVKRLGLRECLDEIEAVEVNGYGVYWGTDSSNISQLALPYPPESVPMNWKDGALWNGKFPKGIHQQRQQGRSFHHGRFVQRLRWKALSRPSVTVLQATVTDLIRCPKTDHIIGVKVKSSSSENQQQREESVSFFAPISFIMDGCFSKFRRLIASEGFKQPTVRSHFVGLLLKTPTPFETIPLPGHGHVILRKKNSDGIEKLDAVEGEQEVGPVLVYQIGSAETRMLVDVPGAKVPSLSNGSLHSYLERQVGAILPLSLLETFQATLDSNEPEYRLRVMPNSYLPPHLQDDHAGVILMGDSMNMRHPLTGGGMTVALLDVEILSDLLAELNDFENWSDIEERLEIWHHQRKKSSTCINVLAQALYSLFGAEDENLEVLKEGCFKYFELGGRRNGLQFFKSGQILWTACVTFLPVLWAESSHFDSKRKDVSEGERGRRTDEEEEEEELNGLIGGGNEDTLYRSWLDWLAALFPSTIDHTHHPATSITTVPASKIEANQHPIESLIVTTKAPHVLDSLKLIRHRLSAHSTVLLLHNGLGVVEELIENCFQEPNSRPTFVLATTSHGVYRLDKGIPVTDTDQEQEQEHDHVDEPCHGRFCHAGIGDIRIGVLPNTLMSQSIERFTLHNSQHQQDNHIENDNPILNPLSQTKPNLINHLPNIEPETKSLYHTISSILNPIIVQELSTKWLTMAEFQTSALIKLTVNAAINPISGLLETRNEGLYRESSFSSLSRRVCEEASAVFEAQSGGGQPFRPHHPLSVDNLQRVVNEIIHATRENISSMCSDLRTLATNRLPPPNTLSKPNLLRIGALQAPLKKTRLDPNHEILQKSLKETATEIDYINGYISRLGSQYLIQTPVNDSLADLVKLKSVNIKRGLILPRLQRVNRRLFIKFNADHHHKSVDNPSDLVSSKDPQNKDTDIK